MALPGCSALSPDRVATDQRLAAFPTAGLPIEAPVTIRWNGYAVPYIEAQTDSDLAFALGLVHAHLREGQLALGKRIVQGRLSEIAGPFAADIDQALRTIDFAHATAEMEARLPPESRQWLQSFVDGLNWYQDHVPAVPPEYGLLGLEREKWTIGDILAGGRLAGVDINWLTYFSLLGRRGDGDWPEAWRRALAAGSGQTVSFGEGRRQDVLQQLFTGFSRSGSNSVVVGPGHSVSGAPLLASDPHIAQTLPNFWLLVGVQSPSYHAVGLMPPGLPVIGVGRNEHLAWGGTNMRAAQSDLFDVSGMPPDSIETRREHVSVRWWFDREVTIRRSPLGPIISDLSVIPGAGRRPVALRWVGQQASDEVTAFLKLARARTGEEFRQALATYGVAGQNMQFATATGDIGQVMAAWLPVRQDRLPADLVLDPQNPQAKWSGLRTALDLPWVINPPDGVIASANNPPAALDIPVGYFFNPTERVDRLKTLLTAKPRLSVDDLKALQQDVVSPASLALKTVLVAAVVEAGLAGQQPQLLAALEHWNGAYDVSATGPVAFETLLYHVAHGLYAGSPGGDIPAGRAEWSSLVAFLADDLAALPAERRRELLRRALDDAAADARRFAGWGDMHHMRVRHTLAALPIVGWAFVEDEYPVAGSRETPMKMAHGLVHDRHTATYGSQARFIADLSDPDASLAVLFGGQDGWLGSANYADQVAAWRDGNYIRLPMRPDAVAAEFPAVLRLLPRRN